jgi:rfaE bifunctional protein kinase chain/domain
MDTIQSMKYPRLKDVVNSFSRVRVLVIGDLILDEFIWGQVSRISPEAPIPVVWVKSESFVPGGSCNVANNIRSLGGQADVIGVIGNEGRGRMLLELLEKKDIGVSGIIKDASRPTTLKTRVVAHHQQVVRIDREEVAPLSKDIQRRIIADVRRRIKNFDAVCVEDYGKGVITPELVQEIVKLARRYGKIITVDPKESHLSYYRGVSCITPNHHEASTLAKIAIRDDASLSRAGQKLLRVLACENVLITRGENGMCLFQKGLKPVKIPTLAQDVFDVSGAGDTVIGTYTLALGSKAAPIEAAHLANCAAGIVVGKVGTATVTQNELLARVRQLLSVTSEN